MSDAGFIVDEYCGMSPGIISRGPSTPVSKDLVPDASILKNPVPNVQVPDVYVYNAYVHNIPVKDVPISVYPVPYTNVQDAPVKTLSSMTHLAPMPAIKS